MTSSVDVRAAAHLLDAGGYELDLAARRLAVVDPAWRGAAADAATARQHDLVERSRAAAAAHDAAADVLRACARSLEEAEALQQRADDPRNAADATTLREAALRRAVSGLHELTARPLGPRRAPLQHVVGFGAGAWRELRDTALLADALSPSTAVSRPLGWWRTALDTARGLGHAAAHPRAAASAAVGWDELRAGAYGEWLGALVAGAVIPGGRVGRVAGLARLVDTGGPVRLRPGVRVPRGFPARIKDLAPERRVHILDGDGPSSGGHRSGTGKAGKTEFPPHWTDDDIISRVMQTAMRPEKIELQKHGSFRLTARFDGVTVAAVVARDGSVVTGYPLPGGRGVVDNGGSARHG